MKMKYSMYDTGKFYRSACEGVQEWSKRPLKLGTDNSCS